MDGYVHRVYHPMLEVVMLCHAAKQCARLGNVDYCIGNIVD